MGNPKTKTLHRNIYQASEAAKRDLLECVYQIARDLKDGKEPEFEVNDYQKKHLIAAYDKFGDFNAFHKAFRTLKTPNVSAVVGRMHVVYTPKGEMKKKLNTGPAAEACKVLYGFTKYENPTPEMVSVLERVRNYLERYVQRETSVFDMTYVRYWDCCHCGEIAPPGGHHLTFYGKRGWKYPVCPKCVEKGTPVDLERLAELYYTYALQIEHAYNKIR